MNKPSLHFFIFLLAFLSACKQKKIPYGHNAAAGKFYNIRGIRIYCEVYGRGTPLLMIHGNGGSIESFSQNIPFFSKNYKVIVADSRAQGNTKDNADSLSFEMMADDAAALLEALQIDSAYVLGWSDGGITAILLAMRHPAKVMKLAATGANLWPDSTAIIPAVWKEDKAYYDTATLREHVTAEERNSWKLFLLDWLQPHISLSSLRSINCPSLIICGDSDIITLSHTKLIAGNIPQGSLWVVPNSGHATLIKRKDEFNKRVDQFFSKEER